MVVELSSGPQGKAAVDRRVVEANVRVAETVCVRAVCTEALTRIRARGQSRARTTAAAEQQATESGSSKSAEAAGLAGPQLQSSEAHVDRLMVGSGKGKEKQRKKRHRAKRRMQN